MSRTYTSVAERVRFQHSGRPRAYAGHILLALTSAVALLALLLAYLGRMQTFEITERSERSERSAGVTDLNAVSTADELAPLFERLFSNASDRRLAAEALMGFILSVRASGDGLPNVGAVLRASVHPGDIERASTAEYLDRLNAARLTAAQSGQAPPEGLPVLTAADLAVLKPALVVRSAQAFRGLMLFWGCLYFASFWVLALVWLCRNVRGDLVLLAAAHLLTAIGFAALVSRADPLRDSVLFERYVLSVVAGVCAFGAASFLNVRKLSFVKPGYIPLLAALFLAVLVIAFGDGPGNSSVKVNLGPVQPVEAIRLLLVLFLAGYFARRWELLRQIDADVIGGHRIPRWLQIPRINYILPVIAGVTLSLVLFFLQKDLGPALFISIVFLTVYAVARNRAGLAVLGFGLLVSGFYAGYMLNVSATLSARVQMWLSPWDNAVRGGDQIAHSLWGLSTGGLFGAGFGLGGTQYLPAGHTDLILAAAGEELGFAGLVLIAAIYTVMARRGIRVALRSVNDYEFFLATAVTLFLVLPVLIMAAGTLGVVPLTGMVTPFLSYGGSAMLSNFAGLGILAAIRSQTLQARGAEPFFHSVRYLQAALGAVAVGLVVVLMNVQFLSADQYAIEPQLGLQADGGRRYQYNPRVLDVARRIPRGSIYDRRGVLLATSSAAAASEARSKFEELGIPLDLSCTEPFERCYPLGGKAFHILGDSRTRENWNATNTSYVERDFESRLRGFDDHAVTVDVPEATDGSRRTIRRDYRDLVPLLRHRYQADHSEWQKFLSRPRDITLTIDARLQSQVMSILARHAAKSVHRRAAAVVVNPDTGELLAAASYPYPRLSQFSVEADGNEALFDRARYGLYPPGSTFKLVTAAAALRGNTGARGMRFECSELGNGRVGAVIPGWGTVRDDVLDTHAHGSISMHDGIVRSCNAYFAQLAVHIGAEGLLETARRFGISTTPSNSIERLRETLPQAGYGQGYVVTTPMRMARVAAAVAGGGLYRELRIEAGESQPATHSMQPDAILSAEAAGLLGRYLREAVLAGTGRSLRSHPSRIAGKTGTAEIAGLPSHSWFAGFAPYGPAHKRIAFAVIIENAGYGGLAAAPAAGDIVRAAAALGFVD
jgi:cell division protein FtsW (lipid II flippase)